MCHRFIEMKSKKDSGPWLDLTPFGNKWWSNHHGEKTYFNELFYLLDTKTRTVEDTQI